MDINEITMWVSHAGTSLGVNGDAYGAKMPGEAVESLRARLAEVEAQRDGLASALQKISDGRGMIPDKSTIFMNGKVPEVPKVFNHYDMRDIAREALAKLEATDGK